MIINIKDLLTGRKKQNLHNRLNTLKAERKMIDRAYEEQAASRFNDTDVLTAEEIANLLNGISPSGFVYRVELPGAAEMYRSITLGNYRELVDKLGHMERESEFLRTLCLIDKCEEFGDYDRMIRAFKFFEYVVGHNKTNAPAISYARRFNIEMRKYLEQEGLL